MCRLEEAYRERKTFALEPIARGLQTFLADCFEECPRIDRISVRAKDVDRFLAKAAKEEDDGSRKYSEPLDQIQDQVGARIVTFYKDDVETVSEIVLRYFRAIEEQVIVPDTEAEFTYFGHHFILYIPPDVIDGSVREDLAPRFFELQVKTLFQHAWSEANHDLGYKPEGELSADDKRKMAFTSAQAWGADEIFNELFQKLQKGVEREST